MRRMIGIVVVSLCVVFSQVQLAAQQASDTEKLTRLDNHLGNIARDAETSRVVSGAVLIGSGVLFAGGGLYVYTIPTDSFVFTEDVRNIIGGVCIGTGVVFGVIGGLALIPSDFETVPQRFSAMPQTTEDEMKAKVAAGETDLQSLADKAQFNQFMEAGSYITVGIAALLYLPDYENLNIYEAVLDAGLGVVELFVQSVPERENQAYKTWKSGLADAGQASPALSLVGTPDGLALSLKL